MVLLGQGKVEMTQPKLMFVNDTLIIRYGFIGSKPWDVFKVRLEITDSAGSLIPAKSYTGDIGDSIYGGLQKIILWDMAADSIAINQSIYVEVVSEKLETIGALDLQSAPGDSLGDGLTESDTAKKDDNPLVAEKEKSSVGAVPYKKNNALFSVIVPGWGLTRLYNSKPYWLIGVAGFGCIATSVYFNHQAANSYDNYMESYDVNVYPDYYSDAEQQYLISNIFAYSAIAIWVIDLGVTILCAEKVRKSLYSGNLSHMSIGSGYQSNTGTAFLTMNYRF